MARPTADSLAEGLMASLSALEGLEDDCGHALGPSLRKDALLILSGTPQELDEHWAASPKEFVSSPAAQDFRTTLLARLGRIELLDVFDRHGQHWRLVELTRMPLGSNPLRKALITRPPGEWAIDTESNLERVHPVSRITLAATWCDAGAVDALLSQASGPQVPHSLEDPTSPAQALLLGAAMGALHAQRMGRLDEFLPLLDGWWSQALMMGADPTEESWLTIPLSQNLVESGRWQARPWGFSGLPSSFLVTDLAQEQYKHHALSYQVPASPLGVLAQALSGACLGTQPRQESARGSVESARRLVQMLLPHPAGSVCLTSLLLSVSNPSHVERLMEAVSDSPAWDLSAPGPVGFDPFLVLLEKVSDYQTPHKRRCASALIDALGRHHAHAGARFNPPSDAQFKRWCDQLCAIATDPGVMRDARTGVQDTAKWLEDYARPGGWLALSSGQEERWGRLCTLFSQALRDAPDASEGPQAAEQFRLDMKLVPATADNIRPTRRQRF